MSLQRKIDNNTDIKLTLNRPLDYEKFTQITLFIFASDVPMSFYDESLHELSHNFTKDLLKHITSDTLHTHSLEPSILILHVDIIDVNDNAPRFENSTIEIEIMENTKPQKVANVKAIDEDSGINARVGYYFNDITLQRHSKFFTIEKNTGVIGLKTHLDRETTKNHKLVIVARDEGVPAMTSEAILLVTVTDENDNNPIIKVQTFENEQAEIAKIAENTTVGSFVGHVVVTDADEGPNGEIKDCSLITTVNNQFKNIYNLESVGYNPDNQPSFEYKRQRRLEVEAFSIKRTASRSGFQIETSIVLDRETIPRFFELLPNFLIFMHSNLKVFQFLIILSYFQKNFLNPFKYSFFIIS